MVPSQWLDPQLVDSMFSKGPVIVFRWLAEEGWPVEFVSPNIEQFGYTQDDFLSSRIPYEKFVHPDDLARVAQEVTSYSENGNDQFEQRYRVLNSNGEVRSTYDYTVIQRDSTGRITHYVGYLLDTTLADQAHMDLEVQEARLRFALKGSGTGLWDWQLLSGEVFFDNQWKRMLGYEPDEIEGNLDAWSSRVHPEDMPMVQRELNRHIDGEVDSYRSEHRLRAKDGSWHWILDQGKAVERDADGRPTRMVGTHQDLTEHRLRLEEDRTLRERALRAQKLESLEMVAAGVAHRFNNLLTTVLGNIDLLEMESSSFPELEAPLDDMKQAARTASELSMAMLSYTGNRLLNRQELDLAEEMPLWIGDWSKSHDQEIELHLDKDLNTIIADAHEVQQALNHVLENACEAGGDKPLELIVSQSDVIENCSMTCSCNLPFRSGTPFLRIRVRDFGEGMTESVLERMYDPFFSTRQLGRGLGMAAVQGILKAHQGGMMVQSEPGQGSIVDLIFPLSKTQDVGSTASSKNISRVLIIEEDPLVARVLSRMLTQMECRCDVVLSCEEGKEVFSRHADEYVAVVLDLSFHGVTGLSCYHRIRGLSPDLPIVFTSGQSESSIANQLAGLDVAAVLRKPFTSDLVGEVFRPILEPENESNQSKDNPDED